MKSVKFVQLLMLTLLWLIASCMPSAPSGKRSGSSSSEVTQEPKPINNPTFTSSGNYIQNGSTTSFTSITIAPTFLDGFYLRGPDVHQFIKDKAPTTVQCLIARFAGSSAPLLVMAARPKSVYNFTTTQREYYYFIETKESANLTYCNRASLIGTLALSHVGEAVTFTPNGVCANCVSTTITSSPFILYTTGGVQLLDVKTTNLFLKIALGQTTSTPSNLTCTSSGDCQGRGYDCCSLGQCVNDKTVKSSTNQTSSEYLQSLQDIATDPSRIYNYPNLYHLCPATVTPTPTPVPTVNGSEGATARLTQLKELYDCTTPLEGEMAICTVKSSNIGSSGTLFTSVDDRNFRSTNHGSSAFNTHSITQIIHAGEEILVSDCSNALCSINSLDAADTISTAASVTINRTPNPTASNTDLKIKFKIDGSCKKINSNLARCTKYFVQGQDDGKVDDHRSVGINANNYFLPAYADPLRLIQVKVDGVIRLLGSHWTQGTGVGPGGTAGLTFISFTSDSLAYDTQTVEITYYVDLTANPTVMTAKLLAQTEINTFCNCVGFDCSLKPSLATDGITVTDYKCVYPQPLLPEPPIEQTIFLSAKTVPLRYFDEDGIYYRTIDGDTPDQEGSLFEYENSDKLKPTNLNSDVGFNEIYGSLTRATTSAKPAYEVRVKKGKTYDIWVDNTVIFSTCANCGNDYYSQVAKLFPKNFQHNGAGWAPDRKTTDRFSTQYYRADDILFGRACFVPATMIPWTHTQKDTLADQRRERLQAQHALFANGYNRDWYGFDYGALIGSFDGVKWFAIGNQRRIKATTSKLFLAINSYFGDLTQDSTYSVTVSDASVAPNSGSIITTDFLNDGAQCQSYHSCSTDRDCAGRLGWDYVCEDVSSMQTIWPLFDDLAVEKPDTALPNTPVTLASLVGGVSTGGSKRCVYRGRGAPCDTRTAATSANHYTQTTPTADLSYCSSNNYCARTNTAVFNNKIARFGVSPMVVDSYVGNSTYPYLSYADTFGLAARVSGRPYDFNGTDSFAPEIISQLSSNYISSICVPGKDISSSTTIYNSQNETADNDSERGDKVLGMGLTKTGNSANAAYYSFCPTFDDNGNYLHLTASYTTALSSSDIYKFSASQNISTNALGIFHEDNLALITASYNAFAPNQSDPDSFVREFTLQENRCMKAPNATCFTDLDCAPSKPISDLFLGIDTTDTTLGMNIPEIKFWQEALVCAQALPKTDPLYDPKNNRCCRDTGKTYTIASAEITTSAAGITSFVADEPRVESIAGIDLTLSSSTRYSLTSTIYSDLYNYRSDSQALRPLLYPSKSDCGADTSCPIPGSPQTEITDTTKAMFETFSAMAERVCCNGHWVRNFSDGNGGGHTWAPTKQQTISKNVLRCYNWEVGSNNFQCNNAEDPDCLVRNFSTTEETNYLEWLGSMEITGIPQAAILYAGDASILCRVRYDDQTSADTRGANGTVVDTASTAEYYDTSNSQYYYSAKHSENFQTGDISTLKVVFSEDQITCCKPLNTFIADTESSQACCSGSTDNEGRCCLPDYTDLTVYYNRYISSGAKGADATLFDPKTGYAKDISSIWTMAIRDAACCSGQAATGIAISNLKIPTVPGVETDVKTKRFVDGAGDLYNGRDQLYDSGLRWNNHLYCVPASFTPPAD